MLTVGETSTAQTTTLENREAGAFRSYLHNAVSRHVVRGARPVNNFVVRMMAGRVSEKLFHGRRKLRCFLARPNARAEDRATSERER